MQQIGGIQLNSKPGTDFNTQYMAPDTGLTNNTTISNNPLYNLLQVIFQNTQTNNISHEEPKCNVIASNGLKVNTDDIKKDNQKIFTSA